MLDWTKNRSNGFHDFFNRYDFLVSAMLTLPLVAKLGWDPISIGNDTRIHLYKLFVLVEQMNQLPPSLAGSWDWNWYAGYPFLKFYGPLSYAVIAILALALGYIAAMRLFLLLYFPLSSISMYFLVKYLTRDRTASIVAGVAFAYIPSHIIRQTDAGGTAFLLSFVFMPLSLLFTEKYLKSQARKHMVLSVLAITCTTYIDLYGGVLFVVFIFAWAVLRGKVFQGFTISLTSLLLSIALIVPAFFYPHTFQPLVSKPPSILEASNVLISHWSIILVLLIVFSYKSLREIVRKRMNHGRLCEVDRMTLVCLFFLGIIGFYGLASSISGIPSLVSIANLNLYMELALGLFLGLTITRFKRRRKIIAAVAVISLLLPISLTIPVYHTLQPRFLEGAFNYVRDDPTWFRVAVAPHAPIGAASPMYTGKPVINGFGAQFSSPELIEMLDIIGGRAFRTNGVKKFETEMIRSPDKAMIALNYLGIKYVIVNLNDPTVGYNYSILLRDAIKESSFASEVYVDRDASVLIVRSFKPIFASTRIRAVNSIGEAYHAITESNEIPILSETPLNVPQSTSEEKVDLKIFSVEQRADAFHAILHVNVSSYIVVPISNSPNLLVVVNGEKMTPLTVVPNFIGIYLPSEGDFDIQIALILPTLDIVAYSVSLTTFLLLVFWACIPTIQKRMTSRRDKNR